MKQADCILLRGGDRVILNTGQEAIVDDILLSVLEFNKKNPEKRMPWIAAGYVDSEHPYGKRIWLHAAQIKSAAMVPSMRRAS